MQKVQGVDSVKVSLKDGLTILDLHAGNSVTLPQLRKVLKDNGFVAKEAKAIVRGTVERRDTQVILVVSPSGDRLALVPPPHTEANSVVEVSGTIEASNDPIPKLHIDAEHRN